jgi:hypothetical protein
VKINEFDGNSLLRIDIAGFGVTNSYSSLSPYTAGTNPDYSFSVKYQVYYFLSKYLTKKGFSSCTTLNHS